MQTEHLKEIDQIGKLREKLVNAEVDHWFQYSSFDSWQFWVLIGMLILPLISLFFLIDRRKAMLLGFFGFNIHVWFTKLDSSAIAFGLWGYPYELIPFLRTSLSIHAAFIPVVFILLYQWTLSHKRNYYLYSTGLCLVFALLWAPLLSALGLFQVNKGNYFYLLLIYLAAMLISKWITNVFIYLNRKQAPLE